MWDPIAYVMLKISFVLQLICLFLAPLFPFQCNRVVKSQMLPVRSTISFCCRSLICHKVSKRFIKLPSLSHLTTLTVVYANECGNSVGVRHCEQIQTCLNLLTQKIRFAIYLNHSTAAAASTDDFVSESLTNNYCSVHNSICRAQLVGFKQNQCSRLARECKPFFQTWVHLCIQSKLRHKHFRQILFKFRGHVAWSNVARTSVNECSLQQYIILAIHKSARVFFTQRYIQTPT